MARPQFYDVPEAGKEFGAELWPRHASHSPIERWFRSLYWVAETRLYV